MLAYGCYWNGFVFLCEITLAGSNFLQLDGCFNDDITPRKSKGWRKPSIKGLLRTGAS